MRLAQNIHRYSLIDLLGGLKMARLLSGSRMFNGKKYLLARLRGNKRRAEREAKQLRDKGMFVRVTRASSMWAVWARR